MTAQGANPDHARRRLRFTPTQRLRRPAEFQQAFKQGIRLSNPHFSLNVRANGATHARLGLAIAARTIGNAVQRNRLRRLVRETFRMHQHELPAVDIVVGARNEARGAEAAILRASLLSLFARVEPRCAR